MVKVTSQFVELSKSYGRVFAFKWAPLMGEDGSRITIGQTGDGTVTSRSSGTLSATISNLFPKLNAARGAGYARVLQSGMVIVRDQIKGTISKQTNIPFQIGTGEFARAQNATIGLQVGVTPRILEQEKVEMALDISVSLQAGSQGGSPVTTNNSVSTNLVIKSKESAAIGGVVQNISETNYDNTGDDPAPLQPAGGAGGAQAGGGGGGGGGSPLFRLYRSKNYSTRKSQYVIFVTPEIIESASVGTEEIRKKFRRRE
jgi:pilus assembly protein CpaC